MNLNGTPANLVPPWKPGTSGNPAGRPRGSGILQHASKILGDVKGLAAEEIATKLVGRAKKGNLKAIGILLDRLDGPLVRKLEVDHRMVVGIVAHFEVACREIAGEEQAARIIARTLELIEAGNAGSDPERAATEPAAGAESVGVEGVEPVREVSG